MLSRRRGEPAKLRDDALGQPLGQALQMRRREVAALLHGAPAATRSRRAGCPASARRPSPRAHGGAGRSITASVSSATPARASGRDLQPRQQRVLVELEQHLRGDLVPRQLGGAARRDHQQPSIVEVPREVAQRLPRRRIREMHVVEQHDERCVSRETFPSSPARP